MNTAYAANAALVNVPILSLIPQRPPFVLVDRLVYCTDLTAQTEFTIPADQLFCEQGCLSAAGLLENIAQSCAARIGYLSLCQGGDVCIGMIGAISKFVFYACPEVGTTLTTYVEVLSEMIGLVLAHARVTSGERLFAEGTFKIAITHETAS